MKNEIKNCSSKIHQEIKASSFCQDCRVYMCEKCEKYHLEIYNHQLISINKDINNNFIGICNEENHNYKLEYYCKTHNKLCCLGCIAKIDKKGNGQHKDCNICIIEDIREEIKSKIKGNTDILEELFKVFEQSFNNIKKFCEDINLQKEELKVNIQKIFTKLRNEINNREDELLLKVDEKFNKLFFKEDILKKYHNLPSKIKTTLEKGKLIDKEWNDENLISFMNDSLNIENNIKNILVVNEDLEKYYSKKIYSIKYKTQNKEIDEILEKIKSFNDIYYTYEFAKCPLETLEDEKYVLSGEMENIVTKPGKEKKWIRILSKNILEEKKEYTWKIKILKTNSNNIMVGVAQIESTYLDNDIVIPDLYYGYGFMPMSPSYLLNTLNPNYSGKIIKNLGWYFCCKDSKLYSDYPHNYSKKKTY